MHRKVHPAHYNRCKYLSMLGLKLIHVSKRGPMCCHGAKFEITDGTWGCHWTTHGGTCNGKFDVMIPQIAKFMGPTWGPPGPCRPQMGPMLAPWTSLSDTSWFSMYQYYIKDCIRWRFCQKLDVIYRRNCWSSCITQGRSFLFWFTERLIGSLTMLIVENWPGIGDHKMTLIMIKE